MSYSRSRAGVFVAERRDVEGYERGEAQEFVRGLLAVFEDVTGSSRFVVNDPAVAGVHATVLAALVSRIRIR